MKQSACCREYCPESISISLADAFGRKVSARQISSCGYGLAMRGLRENRKYSTDTAASHVHSPHPSNGGPYARSGQRCSCGNYFWIFLLNYLDDIVLAIFHLFSMSFD